MTSMNHNPRNTKEYAGDYSSAPASISTQVEPQAEAWFHNVHQRGPAGKPDRATAAAG
jgi:hypothetical protein